MPALAGLAIAETRSCQRPYSPDGLPLIGPYPGVDGLVLATGHGSVGVTQSLGSGEAVADGLAESAGTPRSRPRDCSADLLAPQRPDAVHRTGRLAHRPQPAAPVPRAQG